MALLTATQISGLAVELLARSVVLPATVLRAPGTEFSGPSGSSVTVRVRHDRTAHVQQTPGSTIDLDGIDETPVTLTVHHIYNATTLTDEDLSLELVDFGAQVLLPAAVAVSRKAEQYIADAMNGLDAADTVGGTTGSDYAAAIKDATLALDEADVPAGARFCAVSPAAARALMDYEPIEDASAYGSPSAIQDAVIGRYAGFTLVKSNALTPGSLVAYHQSAFVMANRAPAIPAGANDAAVVQESGYALRVVRDFDASKLAEICAISTFAGAAVLDAARAYRVDAPDES